MAEQGRSGLAADAAGRADHQGGALLGRGHVALSIGCEDKIGHDSPNEN
jgi:hypothetical protein